MGLGRDCLEEVRIRHVQNAGPILKATTGVDAHNTSP